MIEDLVTAIRNRQAILFAGAGVSMTVGLPSWRTLIDHMGEELGYDRMLRTSITQRRTHSLLRQGIMLYELIPTMPKHRLRPLMARFSSLLQQQPVFTEMFGPI